MKKNIILMLLFAAFFAACKKENETSAPIQETTRSDYFRLPEGPQTITTFKNGKKISSIVRDSLHYIGDVILTTWQMEQLKKNNSSDNQRSYITPVVNQWPFGYVIYKIGPGFFASEVSQIQSVMSNLASITSLKFVQRTSQADYIEIVPSNVSASNIGKAGGKQMIFLAVNPNVAGVDVVSVSHEIGHAIGFFHEQSRVDRDSYINVIYSNIVPSAYTQFDTWFDRGFSGADLGTLDFSSIMLYPSFVPASSGMAINASLPVMTRLDGTTWSRNTSWSSGDIQTAAVLYGPPYARIEYENVVYDVWYSWSNDHEHLEDNVYVRLYENEACTIPFTTPDDKPVGVRYVEIINGATNWAYNTTVVIPANSHELLIQESLVTRVYEAEWGTPTWDESRLFYGISGFSR